MMFNIVALIIIGSIFIVVVLFGFLHAKRPEQRQQRENVEENNGVTTDTKPPEIHNTLPYTAPNKQPKPIEPTTVTKHPPAHYRSDSRPGTPGPAFQPIQRSVTPSPIIQPNQRPVTPVSTIGQTNQRPVTPVKGGKTDQQQQQSERPGTPVVTDGQARTQQQTGGGSKTDTKRQQTGDSGHKPNKMNRQELEQHKTSFKTYDELAKDEQDLIVDPKNITVDIATHQLDGVSAMLRRKGATGPIHYVAKFNKQFDSWLTHEEKLIRKSLKVRGAGKTCRFARLKMDSVQGDFYRMKVFDYTPYVNKDVTNYNIINHTMSSDVPCTWHQVPILLNHGSKTIEMITQIDFLIPKE